MNSGNRFFPSVLMIIMLFGLMILMVWLWFAHQLDQLDREQKKYMNATTVMLQLPVRLPSAKENYSCVSPYFITKTKLQ